jgi:hypothetical protein
MCPQTPSLSPEYSHKAGLQAVITSLPLQVRPVIQRPSSKRRVLRRVSLPALPPADQRLQRRPRAKGGVFAFAPTVTTCIVKTDSKVVAGQVEKEYSAKDPALMQYLTTVLSLERQFKGFTLQHVDRARNEAVDALAKAAVRGETLPSDVFYHVVGTPAIRNPEGLQVTNNAEGHRIVNLIMTEDWWAPITLFLQGYYHPSDVNEAKRLKH